MFHELAGGGDPVLQHRPEAEVLEVGGEAGRQPGRDRGGEAQQPLPEDQREGGAAGGGRGDKASHDAAKVLRRGWVNLECDRKHFGQSYGRKSLSVAAAMILALR